MKKLIILLMGLYSMNSYAQNIKKIDTIYYLLDTASTSSKDRMWDVHEEYPTLKYFGIKCACLVYDRNPGFIYDMKDNGDKKISAQELSAMSLISLPNLILKAKELSAIGNKRKDRIFIIEPSDGDFVIHETKMLRPVKNQEPSIDIIKLDVKKINSDKH